PVRADFLPPPSELVLKSAKKSTTIRLDADVLEWFQAMGKGYQTKINAVLRAYKAVHHG
ncbi:MAG: BrnA antitoxin family protein, partial [Spirochaetota bacterium]